MARVLFSIERGHPALGLSPAHYCMVGAAEAQEHLCEFYYYDVGDTWLLTDYGRVLKDTDVVVATALVQLGDKNVPPEVYGEIVRRGTPVVMVWGESAPDVVGWADRYAPHTTATVFLDTAEHWKQFTKYPEKCHWVPEPKDPRLFCSSEGFGSVAYRDLPVTFIGSLTGRWDRAFNLAYCWASGVGIIHKGGLSEGNTQVTIEGYADYLRRSKITLNFTSAVSFQHINGRTSEATMCGAMLMESESAETARLLEPYVHYVPFKEPFHIDESTGQVAAQPGDLVDKLKYYMGPGQAEAREIAERGQKRAMELFDGRLFWNKIFELASVK